LQAARLHYGKLQASRLHYGKGADVMAENEVISRRYLPHWYVPGAAHFVTYRLFGTLPQHVRDELQCRKEYLLQQNPKPGLGPGQHRAKVHKQLFGLYDAYLDRGETTTWLLQPRLAALVRSNLYHHDREKYYLLAYCVMSNHVHVLFQPIQSSPAQLQPGESPVGESEDSASPLSNIMHSLKSYTAHEANKLLRRSGPFWQAESYDHWVRDEEELERVVNYIGNNPVKAGLVEQPRDWYFCSCHDRYLRDGEVSAWLP